MKILIPLALVSCFGCANNNKLAQDTSNHNKQMADTGTSRFTSQFTPGPPALVYKTRADYSRNVPVILSEDKTTIVSYPHPGDIHTENGFPLPTLLHEGYLLDNRGIGLHVAFLNLTYEVYAAMEQAPPVQDLYKLIIDKDPLTELYNCGNKTALTQPTEQLNGLIDGKKLKTSCKVLRQKRE